MNLIQKKLEKLSPELREMIISQIRHSNYNPFLGGKMSFKESGTPITDFLGYAMLHCNAGTAIDSAIWIRDHLNKGGKLLVSVAGALSSFKVGRVLAELINQDKVHIISSTGANHEEDYYVYVANSCYQHIPRYTELTPPQEAELRDAEFRRITDTFLPEEESVRIIEPLLTPMLEDAQKKSLSSFPHEYFRRLHSEGLIMPDTTYFDADFVKRTSWTHAAYEKNIPIIIPGFEDSTMGNIFAGLTYSGEHQSIQPTFTQSVMKTGIDYMHFLYDWYMKNATDPGIAFLQLGGGISGDFPICVVPSLRHDLNVKDVMSWSGFVEVGSSPMSFGSYSGAGGKEKITWDKLSVDSKYAIIQSDATMVFPLMAAIILGL